MGAGARMGGPVAAATCIGVVYSGRWLLPTGTEKKKRKIKPY